MTRRHRAVRVTIEVGASAAGLVGGHLIDYLLVVPPDRREELLHETGHGYLSYAIVASACLAILAGLAAGRLGFLRGHRGDGAPFRVADLAARLTALQVTSFVALELGERLLSGGGLGHLVGPLLLFGLALQALVAVVASGLLTLIHRTGEKVGRLLGRRTGPVPSPGVPAALAPAAPPILEAFFPQRPVRGPPRTLVTI